MLATGMGTAQNDPELADLAAKYYALDRWGMSPVQFDEQPGYEMDLLIELDTKVLDARRAAEERAQRG